VAAKRCRQVKKKMKDYIQNYDQLLTLLPDYDKFIEGLDTLDKFDFSNSTKEQIYNKFYDYAYALSTNFGYFSSENFNKRKFYRVRLNIDRKKEDLSLVQTYSYPPPFFCSSNGRVNLAGNSMFYCSNELMPAMLECKAKVGDEGFLSIWTGNSNRKIKVGHYLASNLRSDNVWAKMAKESLEDLKNHVTEDLKPKLKHIEALNDFLAKKFVEEKAPYYLTSMLSWELFYGQFWTDLIIYSSVVSNSQFCNIAIHPNSVNENLLFEKVIIFKVAEIVNNIPIVQLNTEFGHLNNSKIEWKTLTVKETELFNQR
jgi:hypothetical protein